MREVRFGWHMPSFPVDGSDGPAFVEQMHRVLRLIEPHVDSIWMDDHVVPWAAWQSNDTPYLECLTTVAYLAAQYPRLKIATGVLCQSYRNPALLAKMAANLQLLTGGRLIFGIGAGWAEEEYRAYNYDFPSAGVRLAQLEETLEIVKRLWTQSPASFEGQHYRIENAYCEPRPDPLPPIIIGGSGEKVTLRLVAQYADGWNFNSPDATMFVHKLDVLRRHCDAVGRDFDTILKTWSADFIAVAATEAEARRIAASSPYSQNLNAIVGTPEQVAEQMQVFIDHGADYIIARVLDFPSTTGIELFVHEVIPRLRAG